MVDYIVVGAGSAGCVLAHRLSERGDREVLLLESGPPDRRAEIRVPAAFPRLLGTECDWGHTTVAQPALDGRRLYWPSGRTLGGSSSINAQIWTRGHSADFAEWAAHGGESWDVERIRSCFAGVEHAATADGKADIATGGLWVGPLRDPDDRAWEFLRACEKAGVPPVQNAPLSDAAGCGLMWVTQRDGRRFSVADGYLKPASHRDNLTVVTETQVQRVLFDGTRAVGVEYRDPAGHLREMTCRREILLCAGAVGSPVLLMKSGVGDPDHLNDMGIPVVAAAAEVGRNLTDHLHVPLAFPSEDGGDHDPRSDVKRYLVGRRGPLSSNLAEAAAFVDVESESSVPDVELLWMPVQFEDHGRAVRERGFTVCVVLLRPHSRGHVRLAQPAGAAPAIDPGYLRDERDLDTMVAGVRLADRIVGSYAADVSAGRYGDLQSDEVARQLVRTRAETLYHPVGTARMGVDPNSVVDPRLRVRGVSGLRVVDAGVMPAIPRAHTNAPTVILAENAARLIADASA